MIKYAKGCTGEEELLKVKEALEYGYFGHSYNVVEFEKNLRSYLETNREVIAVNTGTTAMHVALDALGIGEGDEVIVPSFTFVASAQAIGITGAKPVFCDINADTLIIDVDDVIRKISPRTKAIMPVHYSGLPCDMNRLMEIKEKYGIRIVEDAAHAIGSTYNGKKIGSFGDITCFSFDSIKVITCGEGGAVVTGDSDLSELIRVKRILGIDKKQLYSDDWKKRAWTYDVKTTGFRYHMSNINAAIGIEQLKKIDSFIMRRREICRIYDEKLRNVKFLELLNIPYDTIAPFMYVVKVKDNKRDDLQEHLKTHDIETAISYIPNHYHSLYKTSLTFPVTNKIAGEILCLPLHPFLSDHDIYTVIDKIKQF